MDELVKIIVEKTGLSEEVARNVVLTVIEYLDGKLPAPLGGNLQGFLDNDQAVDTIENLAKGLGSLFANKDE